MNERFSYLQDITVSPGYLRGYRIFKMTLLPLDQKTCQELVFKAVKNRKRSGLIASRSDRLTKICFSPTKATHFEAMMTTVDEVNRDETKVPD